MELLEQFMFVTFSSDTRAVFKTGQCHTDIMLVPLEASTSFDLAPFWRKRPSAPSSLFLHILPPALPGHCSSGWASSACKQLISGRTSGAPPWSWPSEAAAGCGPPGWGLFGWRPAGGRDTVEAACPAQTRPSGCGTSYRAPAQWPPGFAPLERRPLWNGAMVSLIVAAGSWRWIRSWGEAVGLALQPLKGMPHLGCWACCVRWKI